MKSASKALVPAFLPKTASQPELETFVRDFSQLESVHDRNRILAQALQGMCLEQLKALYGVKRGGDRKSGAIKAATCGFDSWEEYLDKTFDISKDTAERRVKCWTAVTARMRKLPAADQKAVYGLLKKPASEYTAQEWEALKKVTHKVTDSASQIELLEEADYLIGEHGAGLRKKKGKPGDPAPDDGEDKAEPTPELLIKDEILAPSERMHEHWYSPLKVGVKKVPLWQHIAKSDLRAIAKKLKEMADDAEEALKNK